VEIESDRRLRFPVGATEFWDAVASTDDYRQWWPWLRTFDARGLFAGDEWRCAVRPPLGYTVRFSVHLDEVRAPTWIRARVSGDIGGRAEIDVEPDDDGCAVHLTSTLAPKNRAFAVFALLAGPLVRRGHDWILVTGAEQFARRALDASVS
jgi:hypothetical protein